MNPMPGINSDADVAVSRSCNCCRDNICESECGLCCFPFFRRRKRHNTHLDNRVTHVYCDNAPKPVDVIRDVPELLEKKISHKGSHSSSRHHGKK